MAYKGKSLRAIITPGLIGNVLEWYEFSLYGFFASTLPPLFFHSKIKLFPICIYLPALLLDLLCGHLALLFWLLW